MRVSGVSLLLSALTSLLLFIIALSAGRVVMSRLQRAPPKQTDREICHHGVFMGATGAGKTTGLLNQWRAFARRGYGLLWLGLDAEDCRKAYGIAKSEGYPVEFVDVADETRDPPPYNLLRQVTGTEGELDLLAGEFVSVVRQLNPGAWGMRIQAAVERATVELLEAGRRGGFEVTPQHVLDSLRRAEEEDAAEKVARLLRTSRMRRLLGTTGGFDLAPKPGTALIISLDLGKLQSLAPILASVFASGILREGFLHDPNDPVLAAFLDEWQMYAGPRHPLMLEQLRRRGVTIQAAMQHLSQADPRLQAAIRQVGSLYLYRLEINDAKHIGPFLGVKPEQLVGLPDHIRLARELVGGKMRVTFQSNAEFGRPRGGDPAGGAEARVSRPQGDSARVVREPAGGAESAVPARAGGTPAADDARRASGVPHGPLGGAGRAQGGGGSGSLGAAPDRMAAGGAPARRPGEGGRADGDVRRTASVARGAEPRPRTRGPQGAAVPRVLPEESDDLSPFDLP